MDAGYLKQPVGTYSFKLDKKGALHLAGPTPKKVAVSPSPKKKASPARKKASPARKKRAAAPKKAAPKKAAPKKKAEQSKGKTVKAAKPSVVAATTDEDHVEEQQQME